MGEGRVFGVLQLNQDNCDDRKKGGGRREDGMNRRWVRRGGWNGCGGSLGFSPTRRVFPESHRGREPLIGPFDARAVFFFGLTLDAVRLGGDRKPKKRREACVCVSRPDQSKGQESKGARGTRTCDAVLRWSR